MNPLPEIVEPEDPPMPLPTQKALEAQDLQGEKNLWSNVKLQQDNPSVQYVSMSSMNRQACGNCRWYKGEDYCHLVECEPLPITAIGYCNRHELRTADLPMFEALLGGMGEMEEGEGMGMGMTFNIAQRDFITRIVKSLLKSGPEPTGFKVIDDDHWIGWWTNNFEDRQKELFSAASIDDYINRVKSGMVPYPELWFYHVPGTKHGQATDLWRVDHFGVAYGTFDQGGHTDAFKAYYKKVKDLGMSHGFYYPDWALSDGVFHKFTTFELTTLKPAAAANPYTTFKEMSEMAVSPSTIKELEAALGKDVAAQIVADAEGRGKALEATQRYKSFEAPVTHEEFTALKGTVEQVLEAVKKLTAPDPASAQPDGKKEEAPVTLESLSSEIKSMRKEFTDYKALQPRGSQHPGTLLSNLRQEDKAAMDYLRQKGAEGQKGMSLVQRAVKAASGVPTDEVPTDLVNPGK